MWNAVCQRYQDILLLRHFCDFLDRLKADENCPTLSQQKEKIWFGTEPPVISDPAIPSYPTVNPCPPSSILFPPLISSAGLILRLISRQIVYTFPFVLPPWQLEVSPFFFPNKRVLICLPGFGYMRKCYNERVTFCFWVDPRADADTGGKNEVYCKVGRWCWTGEAQGRAGSQLEWGIAELGWG